MNSKIWLFGLAVCLVCSFSACKSKQSAYKAAYEKAKDKEPTETVVVVEEVVPVSKPKEVYTPSATPSTPKKEKVTSVSGTVNRYSVVIGSFQNKTNAISLKDRMEAQGEHIILAQNEAGMYRVIIASYNSKESADSKRDQIKVEYAPAFQDAWVLEQAY